MHRLALRLGKTVSELCRDLTAREFSRWLAYFEIESYGEDDERRMAIIASTIAQCAGNKVTMNDFLPKKPETIDDQIERMRAKRG